MQLVQMWKQDIAVGLAILGVWFAAGSATAASIAVGAPSLIAVGETATATFEIVLDVGEDASIFEGAFELVGLDATASIVIDAAGFGPTWDAGAFGNVIASQDELLISLTALSNRSDHSLLATIDITGLQAGTFNITLGAGTFLQRDLNVPPFFEDVALSPPAGTTLASIQIVPEPSMAMLVMSGFLMMLAGRSRSS